MVFDRFHSAYEGLANFSDEVRFSAHPCGEVGAGLGYEMSDVQDARARRTQQLQRLLSFVPHASKPLGALHCAFKPAANTPSLPRTQAHESEQPSAFEPGFSTPLSMPRILMPSSPQKITPSCPDEPRLQSACLQLHNPAQNVKKSKLKNNSSNPAPLGFQGSRLQLLSSSPSRPQASSDRAFISCSPGA